MNNYIALARPYQWYKNLVVFIAVFFSGLLFSPEPLILSILGFISLCLVSSANYIINDILDVADDRKHPEKKNRPIASGAISVTNALLYSALLLVISLGIGLLISAYFLIALVGLFALTLVYSLGLKKEPVLDIIIIGINFVIRAISGAIIIKVAISPWLIVCTFFLPILLASAKREGEIRLIGKYAKNKNPLRDYIEIAQPIKYMSATVLIVAYSLYSFIKHPPLFMTTLPVFVYGVLYFLLITKDKSKIARNPHLVFFDSRMLLSGIVMLLLLAGVLYV